MVGCHQPCEKPLEPTVCFRPHTPFPCPFVQPYPTTPRTCINRGPTRRRFPLKARHTLGSAYEYSTEWPYRSLRRSVLRGGLDPLHHRRPFNPSVQRDLPHGFFER